MVTSDLVLSFSWFVDFAQYEQWQDFAIAAAKHITNEIYKLDNIFFNGSVICFNYDLKRKASTL